MADNEGGAAVSGGDTEQMLPKSKELSWWTPKRIEMPHIQGLRLVCMVSSPPFSLSLARVCALAVPLSLYLSVSRAPP